MAAAYQVIKLPFRPARGLSSGSEYKSLLSVQSPDLRKINNLFTAKDMTSADLDVLTLTAANLKTLLENGSVSTAHLVDLYLGQIEKHNHDGAKLNAVICTAPRAMAMQLARQLDDERAQKKLRGPMHGIPIIIKASKTCPAIQ